MELAFRHVPFDAAEVQALLDEYRRELGGFGIVLDERGAGAVTAAELAPPGGVFVVADVDGAPAACGGVRVLGGGVAEVKRMFVVPAARRRGVGGALLRRLEDLARAGGCTVVRLDTGPGMAAALGLYRSAGYREIADYNGNPQAGHWLEKELPARGAAAGGKAAREGGPLP